MKHWPIISIVALMSWLAIAYRGEPVSSAWALSAASLVAGYIYGYRKGRNTSRKA